MALRRLKEVLFWLGDKTTDFHKVIYEKVYDLNGNRLALEDVKDAPLEGDLILFKMESDLGRAPRIQYSLLSLLDAY